MRQAVIVSYARTGLAKAARGGFNNTPSMTMLGHAIQHAVQRSGVDPAEVLGRVQALTDAEAQALAAQIDAAPAGASDILGTIVFIFVLLLVTDILGLTKVFPFTRSLR